MHYVIGDIHGCYREMTDLIKKIESQDYDAKYIFVGDFIDRGSDVDKVLEWCIANITLDGKYQSVRGNHEQMALNWMEEWLTWWEVGGFHSTLLMPESRYDFSKWMNAMGKLEPEKLMLYQDFFLNLPFDKKIQVDSVWGKNITYRVVHAGYCYDKVSVDEQHYINLWERDYDKYENIDEIVIHGHTPTLSRSVYGHSLNARPGLISYLKNDINVDCGCVFHGKGYEKYPAMCGAICLENLQEIYPYAIEKRFMEIANCEKERNIQQKYYEEYKNHYLMSECKEHIEMCEKLGQK